ncbi:MAG: ABC transporter ATP-binding protein [Verrucomicrobiota bacterium]
MNAILLEHVTKAYRLYHHPGDRLKEVLHPGRKRYHQDFCALQDINIAIQPGETIGIIGRNGSGKSTLLKLIAGILTPTAGTVAARGKVAALLELGAGFNPELTGLENFYFNGILLGYSRREMEARREAVIAFADIGDYLDQPVKHYSSGMFVRLAFAVAVQVDPDILIVDEALAVGDLNFQARCFRKLDEFRAAGKTVLLVTHALDSVLRYCSRTMVLDKGCMVVAADSKQAVDIYKQLMANCYDATPVAGPAPVAGLVPNGVTPLTANPDALVYGEGQAEIVEYGLFDEHNRPTRMLQHGQRFLIRMKIIFHAAVHDPIFAFTIKDLKGMELTGTNTQFKQVSTGSYDKGDSASVEFSQTLNAQSGRYALSLGCTGYERDAMVVYHRLYDILLFETVSAMPMVGCYDLDSAISIQRMEERL